MAVTDDAYPFPEPDIRTVTSGYGSVVGRGVGVAVWEDPLPGAPPVPPVEIRSAQPAVSSSPMRLIAINMYAILDLMINGFIIITINNYYLIFKKFNRYYKKYNLYRLRYKLKTIWMDLFLSQSRFS
ncbi:MAG: hypothetical protein QHG99_04510 [Methanomicrobiales archaeon]|nr:hypothetical protein [Methanomicrobiales archaeon]